MLCRWLFYAFALQIVTAQYFQQTPFTTAMQEQNPGSYYNLLNLAPRKIDRKNLPKNGIAGKFYPGIGFVADDPDDDDDSTEENSTEEDDTDMSTDSPNSKEKRNKKKKKKNNRKSDDDDEDVPSLYLLPAQQAAAVYPYPSGGYRRANWYGGGYGGPQFYG